MFLEPKKRTKSKNRIKINPNKAKRDIQSESTPGKRSANSLLNHIKNLPEHSSKLQGKKLSVKSKSKKNKKVKSKGRLKIILGCLLFIGIIAAYFIYSFVYKPVMNVRNAVNDIRHYSILISEDFDKKDIRNLNYNVDQIQLKMDVIHEELDKFGFLKSMSITKGYYDNVTVLDRILKKSNILIDDSLPQLTVLLEASGFAVTDEQLAAAQINDNSLVNVTDELVMDEVTNSEDIDLEDTDKEDNALNLVLAEFPEYLDLYESVEPQIIDIFNEFNNLNPDYIPRIGGKNLRERVERIKVLSEDFPEISNQTAEFLRYVPELIGSDGDAKYLLVLQNEAELRSSGGLITAYGVLTMSKGEVEDIFLTDTWNLTNYLSDGIGVDPGYYNIYGQAALMIRGCGSYGLRSQDTGIYPDLQWSMRVFSEYYDIANEYNPIDFPAYDHVITLNFSFAENFLELLQPLEVDGFGVVTAETLFDFIKNDTDDPELSFSTERKRIIEDIAEAAGKKFGEFEIKQIPDLAQVLVSSFYAKDLALYSENEELQTYFDQYAMDGAIIKDYQGDYFHLNEAQNCSLKLNKWVRDVVTQEVTINEDGSIDRSINVSWEQPKVYEDDLKLQYDTTGKFTYRAWVRIFAPEETENFDSDGFEQSGFIYYYPEEYYDEEMDKSVSDNIIQFNHIRLNEEDEIPTHELNVMYSLPDSLNYKEVGIYKLLLQKHPGKSWGEKYMMTINEGGKSYTAEFILDQDKVLTYRNGIITIDNYHKNLDWLVKLVNNLPFGEME